MSAYNDFMLKFLSGFTSIAEQYALMLNQGINDCCLKRKLQILYMYRGVLTRGYIEGCIDSTMLDQMTLHITNILGTDIGTITGADVMSSIPQIVVTPGTETDIVYQVDDDEFAFNTTIGLTPVDILFTTPLGSAVDGSDYALTFMGYTQQGAIANVWIINRTQYGFQAYSDEENVTFEGSAKLKG